MMKKIILLIAVMLTYTQAAELTGQGVNGPYTICYYSDGTVTSTPGPIRCPKTWDAKKL